MTRSRLILTVLLAVAGALLPAGAASAQDPQASASVSLADGPQVAHGAHRMTVTWSAACASADASVLPQVAIDVMVVRKRARAKPEPVVSVYPNGAQGSKAVTVDAGGRVFAQIRNECTRLEFVTPTEPDGEDTIEHTDRITARSPGTIAIPPWIGHARLTGCGRLRLESRWLGLTTPKAAMRAMRIRLRGAGLHTDVRPAKVDFRLGERIEADIAPRRTGRLRISASIGGVRSNTVVVHVRRVC